MELIDKYVKQRILYGVINSREDLIKSLSEIGKVARKTDESVSLHFTKSKYRLSGSFYNAGFLFDAYREDQKRRTGAEPILSKHSIQPEEYSRKLSECLEQLQTVRRKRIEYNQRYYQAKTSGTEQHTAQRPRISAELGATAQEKLHREKNHRFGADALSDQERYPLSGFDTTVPKTEKIARKLHNGIEPIVGYVNSNKTNECSNVQRLQPHDDNYKEDPSAKRKQRFEGYTTILDSDRTYEIVDSRVTSTKSKEDPVSFDIRGIQYPFADQKFYLDLGVKNESNAITDAMEPNCSTDAFSNRSFETTSGCTHRGNRCSTGDDSETENVHQRTREIAEATTRLSSTYAQRKLALEQEAQRYEDEVNRERQDHQAISRRNQQRDFLERTYSFFRGVKNQIRGTFKAVIDSLIFEAPDSTGNRGRFKTVSECIDGIGIHRLVNIARQRTQLRKHIDNAKRFKQDLERTKETLKQELALNIMSAELNRITENFPQLDLKNAFVYVLTAERCFHEFRDANESDEEKELCLAEYVYSIEKCFKELEKQLNNLKDGEFDALKKLTTVIESHLGQIQSESIDENDVVYYGSAKRDVRDLAVKFRNELNQQEITFSNNIFSVKGVNHSDSCNRSSELNDSNGPEMIEY